MASAEISSTGRVLVRNSGAAVSHGDELLLEFRVAPRGVGHHGAGLRAGFSAAFLITGRVINISRRDLKHSASVQRQFQIAIPNPPSFNSRVSYTLFFQKRLLQLSYTMAERGRDRAGVGKVQFSQRKMRQALKNNRATLRLLRETAGESGFSGEQVT